MVNVARHRVPYEHNVAALQYPPDHRLAAVAEPTSGLLPRPYEGIAVRCTRSKDLGTVVPISHSLAGLVAPIDSYPHPFIDMGVAYPGEGANGAGPGSGEAVPYHAQHYKTHRSNQRGAESRVSGFARRRAARACPDMRLPVAGGHRVVVVHEHVLLRVVVPRAVHRGPVLPGGGRERRPRRVDDALVKQEPAEHAREAEHRQARQARALQRKRGAVAARHGREEPDRRTDARRLVVGEEHPPEMQRQRVQLSCDLDVDVGYDSEIHARPAREPDQNRLRIAR
mmetsp:Transcript_23376/g.55201  ORF Transcript_23376/g.55201 Transcript_23376/m.55201 type:complete len:283 (-) Transcript_23376:271-1119(-)